MNATLEHINVTLKDINKAAKAFTDIFGWEIRWQGDALDNGRTIHVGSPNSYLALYTHKERRQQEVDHKTIGHLNHIAIVVDNLDAIESRVKSSGFKAYNHGDYEPGRRFYFDLDEHLEVEVVSYA